MVLIDCACRDLRASSRPLFQYVESHNDDVTEVRLSFQFGAIAFAQT